MVGRRGKCHLVTERLLCLSIGAECHITAGADRWPYTPRSSYRAVIICHTSIVAAQHVPLTPAAHRSALGSQSRSPAPTWRRAAPPAAWAPPAWPASARVVGSARARAKSRSCTPACMPSLCIQAPSAHAAPPAARIPTHLFVQCVVGREQRAVKHGKGGAVRRRHAPARLFEDDDAGRDIPRLQLELIVCVHLAWRGVE